MLISPTFKNGGFLGTIPSRKRRPCLPGHRGWWRYRNNEPGPDGPGRTCWAALGWALEAVNGPVSRSPPKRSTRKYVQFFWNSRILLFESVLTFFRGTNVCIYICTPYYTIFWENEHPFTSYFDIKQGTWLFWWITWLKNLDDRKMVILGG